MKKDNILIVHNYYQIPGGEDTVVVNEKSLLIENGHNVYLYTRHNDEIKVKNTLRKILLPFETVFSIKTYRDIKRIIKEKRIDVVHIHNTLPLISPSVYYAAKKCKVRVIQTVHNFRLVCPAATLTRNGSICEDCINNGLGNAIKNKCYRNSLLQTLVSTFNLWIHRNLKTYQKVDGYITLTDFNKQKLSTVIPKEKIFIKPNTIGNFNTTNKRITEDYFLFLGRIDELKGINVLMEAWKDIKESKLVIVGKGPLENDIKKFIEENNIKNIDLIGFKSKEEVMKIINYAKAIIVPSQWYEGFPMTIVESFSLGVPVIGGDIGNLSSIIEHEKNGLLFKYNDYLDLRRKINTLLNNNSLIKVLSKGAKETFEQKYNSKLNYKQLVGIYNECKKGK
ncbi:glycosyltransferase family 4 protein [Neobacillus jeddahensis]|uniref:glycosyltransferase family 4 protein n=1 Tax=Neobacillus jeddahensis TaxID=1461580 RepID=UPI00058CCB00|nr:glycosyltransferase family 4 protein [Neobacillus jeddahensis]